MRKILYSIALTAFIACSLTSSVFAQSKIKATLTPTPIIINQNPYITYDKSLNLSQVINGETYVAAETLLVDGTISGDLLAAAGELTLTGKVLQDFRAVASNLSVSGVISGNSVLAGETVTLTDTASFAKSLMAAASELKLESPVGGNIKLAAGKVYINSAIKGNVEVAATEVTLGPKAQINGNFTYWSDKEAAMDPKAKVVGITTKKDFQSINGYQYRKDFQDQITKAAKVASNTMKIVSFLSMVLLGLIMLRFFPHFTNQTADLVLQKPWKMAGTGFLALAITPIAAIVIMITLIGIPLGILLVVVYFVLLYLAKLFVFLAVGKLLLAKQNGSIYLQYLAGLLIYSAATFIPVVSELTKLATLLVGFGAVIISLKESYLSANRKDNKEK